MKSPLQIDADIVKEFGITPELDVPNDRKLAFLHAQNEELKSMMWRERVNIVHAHRLKESENEVLRSKGETNLTEHRNAVRQTVGGIKQVQQMIEELEAAK